MNRSLIITNTLVSGKSRSTAAWTTASTVSCRRWPSSAWPATTSCRTKSGTSTTGTRPRDAPQPPQVKLVSDNPVQARPVPVAPTRRRNVERSCNSSFFRNRQICRKADWSKWKNWCFLKIKSRLESESGELIDPLGSKLSQWRVI